MSNKKVFLNTAVDTVILGTRRRKSGFWLRPSKNKCIVSDLLKDLNEDHTAKYPSMRFEIRCDLYIFQREYTCF